MIFLANPTAKSFDEPNEEEQHLILHLRNEIDEGARRAATTRLDVLRRNLNPWWYALTPAAMKSLPARFGLFWEV
jgi:hypothetical protein